MVWLVVVGCGDSVGCDVWSVLVWYSLFRCGAASELAFVVAFVMLLWMVGLVLFKCLLCVFVSCWCLCFVWFAFDLGFAVLLMFCFVAFVGFVCVECFCWLFAV